MKTYDNHQHMINLPALPIHRRNSHFDQHQHEHHDPQPKPDALQRNLPLPHSSPSALGRRTWFRACRCRQYRCVKRCRQLVHLLHRKRLSTPITTTRRRSRRFSLTPRANASSLTTTTPLTHSHPRLRRIKPPPRTLNRHRGRQSSHRAIAIFFPNLPRRPRRKRLLFLSVLGRRRRDAAHGVEGVRGFDCEVVGGGGEGGKVVGWHFCLEYGD